MQIRTPQQAVRRCFGGRAGNTPETSRTVPGHDTIKWALGRCARSPVPLAPARRSARSEDSQRYVGAHSRIPAFLPCVERHLRTVQGRTRPRSFLLAQERVRKHSDVVDVQHNIFHSSGLCRLEIQIRTWCIGTPGEVCEIVFSGLPISFEALEASLAHASRPCFSWSQPIQLCSLASR